ncbi:MAG: hemin uptake protein HemP [Pseudomonadota bacterium]
MNAMTEVPQQTNRPEATDQKTYDARALMDGDTTANIVLDGQVYILRITRAGKLILTK